MAYTAQRGLLMLRSIKSRTLAVSVVALGVTVAMGVTAEIVKVRLSSDLAQSTMMATAIRNHTVSDMIHDGLRRVVLNALLAEAIGTPHSVVEAELAEMTSPIDRGMSANKALPLPEERGSALGEVDAL